MGAGECYNYKGSLHNNYEGSVVMYSGAVYVTNFRASDHENNPAYYATTGNICFAKYTELVVRQSVAKKSSRFPPWYVWGVCLYIHIYIYMYVSSCST